MFDVLKLGLAASIFGSVPPCPLNPSMVYNIPGEVAAKDGGTLVVGDRYWTSGVPGIGFLGAAKIVDVASGALLYTVTANDVVDGDLFGWDVGISGNRMIAGSPGKESTYLFDVVTAQQIAKLAAPNGGKSGSVLAIDGDRIVTAHFSKLHVFDATSGQHIRQIDLPSLGTSLAIEGGMVLVGCELDASAGAAAGAAYLFNVETGESLGQLLASDAGPLEWFGRTVKLKDGFAVVGAPGDDNNGVVDRGATYVFDARSRTQLYKLDQNGVGGGVPGTALGVGNGWVASSGSLFSVATGKAVYRATGGAHAHIGSTELFVGKVRYDLAASDCEGGCCFGSSCVVLLRSQCEAAQGEYLGIGVDCDSTPCGPACAADLNGDGVVDAADLTILLGSWGACPG